jgi:hypothetical protein
MSFALMPSANSFDWSNIDLDVLLDPAVEQRDRHARNRDQCRPDQVRGKVVHLGWRHVVRRDLNVENGDGRRIEFQDARRRTAGRELLDDCLRGCRYLRLCGGNICAQLEVDLDDAASVVGLALDMLDIADRRRQRTLVAIDDPPQHVGRRDNGISPDCCDDRNADRGKDVGWCLEHRVGAEQQDQNGEDYKRVGPAMRTIAFMSAARFRPRA